MFDLHGILNPCSRVFVEKLRGGADKSLGRPGRKQATATKLGIYSTCSPRSSTHFLARCSNFCKPLKTKFGRLSFQPGLRGSNDLRVGRKMATFQLIFQSREQVVVRRGHLHIVQCYRSPSTHPPQQQDTICCKYLSLTLLMMGKILPETC